MEKVQVVFKKKQTKQIYLLSDEILCEEEEK